MAANYHYILTFILSFILVMFAIPVIIEVSIRKKLFAVPNHRTAHQERVIPNLGGIAIFAAVLISSLVNMNGLNSNLINELLLASVVLFLIGLVDDLINLSALKKLVGQLILTSYLILICDIRFTNLHGIFGINEIDVSLSFFITTASMIGLINGFNLIDGIDGLAAGVGTLISSVFGYLFLYYGYPEYAVFSFSIAGALVGFFFYNVFGTKNKIFMGDTGSLALGILFSMFTILLNEISPLQGTKNIAWTAPAITMAIMIVPVVDSIRVMTIRLFRRTSPFIPDMNHIHHELLKITKNHLQASIIVVLSNLFMVCLAFGLINILGNQMLFLLILALGFAMAAIPALINRFKLLKELPAENEQEEPEIIKQIKMKGTIPVPLKFREIPPEKKNAPEKSKSEVPSLGKIQSN